MKAFSLHLLFLLGWAAQCGGSESFCRMICFSEVCKAVKNNTLIIDVRTKQEVAETGLIPGSINIPLACLRTRLEVSRSEFKDDYGHSKPRKGSLIVVTGRSGMPNTDACEILCFLGYKKTRDFVGGFEEWLLKSQACADCKPAPPPVTCEMPCGEPKPTKPCNLPC